MEKEPINGGKMEEVAGEDQPNGLTRLKKDIEDKKQELQSLRAGGVSPEIEGLISGFGQKCERLYREAEYGKVSVDEALKQEKEDYRMIVKRERFERLASKRVTKAATALRMVRNMANTSNYEYTDEQAKKIIRHLRQEFEKTKNSFSGSTKRRHRDKFEL